MRLQSRSSGTNMWPPPGPVSFVNIVLNVWCATTNKLPEWWAFVNRSQCHLVINSWDGMVPRYLEPVCCGICCSARISSLLSFSLTSIYSVLTLGRLRKCLAYLPIPIPLDPSSASRPECNGTPRIFKLRHVRSLPRPSSSPTVRHGKKPLGSPSRRFHPWR